MDLRALGDGQHSGIVEAIVDYHENLKVTSKLGN